MIVLSPPVPGGPASMVAVTQFLYHTGDVARPCPAPGGAGRLTLRGDCACAGWVGSVWGWTLGPCTVRGGEGRAPAQKGLRTRSTAPRLGLGAAARGKRPSSGEMRRPSWQLRGHPPTLAAERAADLCRLRGPVRMRARASSLATPRPGSTQDAWHGVIACYLRGPAEEAGLCPPTAAAFWVPWSGSAHSSCVPTSPI